MELVPANPSQWATRFERHRLQIAGILPGAKIEHIGSTAIGHIRAKDVVDVLVGVPEVGSVAELLQQAGYILEGERPSHVWLCWPHPEQREAVVHVTQTGGEIWHKRLAFRDYLRKHPAEARAYEALKLEIATRTDDLGEYTAQKAAFVTRILQSAAES